MSDLERIIQELETENQDLRKSKQELQKHIANAAAEFKKRLKTEKEMQSKLGEYQKKVDELSSPPLQYASFLEKSDVPLEGEHYVVLMSGNKLLVNADSSLKLQEKITAGELVAGQSVLINSQTNIVFIGIYPSQGHIGTVDDILSDGTLIIQEHLDNKVVPFIGHHIPDSLKVGDKVLMDKNIALSKIQEGDRLRTLEALKVDKSFEEIGAQDQIISELLRMFDDRLKHQEVLRLFGQTIPKGILMYGPPGCGKTTIAKAVMRKLNESLPEIFAKHLKLINTYKGLKEGELKAVEEAAALEEKYKPLMEAKNSQDLLEQILRGRGIDYENIDAEEARITKALKGEKGTICLYADPGKAMQKWWGEGERYVREMFSELRACAKEYGLAAVILDEPETILRTRGSSISSDASDSLVATFNREMDGMLKNSNIIVFLLTNRQDMIDPAVLRPGRIDRKFNAKRPETAEDARKIFQVYLNETHESIIDKDEIAKYRSVKGAVDGIISRALSELYENDAMKIADVDKENGRSETMYFRHIISGAIIEAIVKQAVEQAVDRSITYLKDGKTVPKKLCGEDMALAVRQVYQEEKFVPKDTDLKEWSRVLGVEARAVRAPRKEPEERRRRGGAYQ